jgi:putative transposase
MWQNDFAPHPDPVCGHIRIRVKDNGVVTTKTAYLAIGVDVDGRKHALGCWIQDTEGAKFS